MGHTGSVHRRSSATDTLYGDPVGGANGGYTPAQMQALYLNRGRPDMGFMSNQNMLPRELPEMQRTRTVQNHVNLKKPTLKIHEQRPGSMEYDLAFEFDATKACNIQVVVVAKESADSSNGALVYTPVHGAQRTLSYGFPSGKNQHLHLQEKSDRLDLSEYTEAELEYDDKSSIYPLAVHLQVREEDGSPQSQTTLATFVKQPDGTLGLKILKQKIQVQGQTYELQEIYGMEGSVAAAPKQADGIASTDDLDDGAECIICLSEPRDTTVLPCRHMCLCSECAETLRRSNSTCPICRTRVESLLQIQVEAK